ncbi:hypothetical protein JCM11251_002023 [Rhodosporidiobolus azoricus]
MLDRLPIELLSHTLSYLDAQSPHLYAPREDLERCSLELGGTRPGEVGEIPAQRFAIDGLGFETFNAPPTFPNLVSLSMHDVCAPRDFFSSLLVTNIFQICLHVLHIESGERKLLSPRHLAAPYALLVSVPLHELFNCKRDASTNPFELLHFHLQHFHYGSVKLDETPGNSYRDLGRSALKTLPSFSRLLRLATILLPLSLRHPKLEAQLEAIEAACVEKSIEILWEDSEPEQPEGEMPWQSLREEFCRWVVRKRRKEDGP